MADEAKSVIKRRPIPRVRARAKAGSQSNLNGKAPDPSSLDFRRMLAGGPDGPFWQRDRAFRVLNEVESAAVNLAQRLPWLTDSYPKLVERADAKWRRELDPRRENLDGLLRAMLSLIKKIVKPK